MCANLDYKEFVIQQHIRSKTGFIYFGLKILILHTVGITNPTTSTTIFSFDIHIRKDRGWLGRFPWL